MSTTTTSGSPHRWRFFRTGGLDQVRLETAADLLALENLDLKLWTALACPVKGLEFDEKTLALIDTDGDGRVRAPEVIAAVKWACAALADPADLFKGADSIPLAAIKDPALLASAKEILASLGKGSVGAISLADATDTAKIFATTRLNGDGVVTPATAGEDAEAAQLINEIVATVGGVPDRSGAAGVDAGKIAAFHDALAAYAAWRTTGEKAAAEIHPLGADTPAAAAAVEAVRTKIDDYFSRCRLAAFDARAIAALNRQESEYLALAAKDLSVTVDEIRDFPLARVEAGKPLPLGSGVNPAWVGALAALASAAVAPLLGAGKTSLTEGEWTSLKQKLAPHLGWAAGKAGTAVESLGLERVRAILAGGGRAKLEALVAEDLKLAPQFTSIANVEKLVRYHRDLNRLLVNFVSFADFYSPDRLAVFQAGTLYLDARACELVVRVADAGKHAALAGLSKAYLAYCDCTRPSTGESMQIAAAFTNGDSDHLMVGRNGIFYDRKGRDWDATITKVVDNPISIRQAFFAPYKKFVRMLEEQAAKRAAAAEAASDAKLAGAASATANADKAAKPEPKKFDVGTVAALGVAVSGIVAVLTAIIGGILGLTWWQIPLAVVGVLLFISAPSMIIAALKLRQRSMGPILDANGWAVNGRVKINIPFGTSLTDLARLPAGSERSLDDPYGEKKSPWCAWLILLVVLAGAAWYVRWDGKKRGHYFWQDKPAVEAPAEAAPAPAPANEAG